MCIHTVKLLSLVQTSKVKTEKVYIAGLYRQLKYKYFHFQSTVDISDYCSAYCCTSLSSHRCRTCLILYYRFIASLGQNNIGITYCVLCVQLHICFTLQGFCKMLIYASLVFWVEVKGIWTE